MVFLPTPETEHLLVLTEFSSYAPWLPDTIQVHEEFGFEKEFVIDGLMLDSVSAGNLPTIKFVDANQNNVLKLQIDPSFSTLMIESDFNVRFIYFLFTVFIIGFRILSRSFFSPHAKSTVCTCNRNYTLFRF